MTTGISMFLPCGPGHQRGEPEGSGHPQAPSALGHSWGADAHTEGRHWSLENTSANWSQIKITRKYLQKGIQEWRDVEKGEAGDRQLKKKMSRNAIEIKRPFCLEQGGNLTIALSSQKLLKKMHAVVQCKDRSYLGQTRDTPMRAWRNRMWCPHKKNLSAKSWKESKKKSRLKFLD